MYVCTQSAFRQTKGLAWQGKGKDNFESMQLTNFPQGSQSIVTQVLAGETFTEEIKSSRCQGENIAYRT
jgi:hypothetical protein